MEVLSKGLEQHTFLQQLVCLLGGVGEVLSGQEQQTSQVEVGALELGVGRRV